MTFTTFSTALLATLALVSQSSGHLMMKSPVPFGVDSLNNSPLADAKPGTAASDFPCKQRDGVYDISVMNNMKVGAPQLLDFTGSASHGGGTCQIAVSMDPKPSYNATWKIIQVFEGGCPIDADGNDGTHPFTFTIPENFPNGRATLSWTWYNRIGNREIYMNCAPITVTGGSDSHEYYDSLPDMYVINLPTSECSSVETTNQKIPFPGQFVMEGGSSIQAATGTACAASAAAQTQGVSGYKSASKNDGGAYSAPAQNGDVTSAPAATTAAGASSGAYGASSQAPATSAAASTYAPMPSSSDGLLTIATAAPSASASSPASSAPESSAPAAASSAMPSSYGGGNSSGGSSSGSSSGTSCSQEGQVVCNGTTSFGLCNHGAVVFMPVADGTECLNGQVVRKRSLIEKRTPHLRRHARHMAHSN